MSLKSKESGSLVLVAAKAGKEGSYMISVTPDTISHQIGAQVAPSEHNALCLLTQSGVNQCLLRSSSSQNKIAEDLSALIRYSKCICCHRCL